MKPFQALFIVLMASALFACGSDDGNYDENGNPISSSSTTSEDDATSEEETVTDVIVSSGDAEGLNFNYIGSSVPFIAIEGTSGAGSTKVNFQLLDVNGDPVVAEPVSFTIVAPEGTSLIVESAVTDENGNVSTAVTGGPILGPVAISVTSDNDTSVTSSSIGLSVSIGFPDQNSFSMSLDTLTVPGIRRDNATVTVTVGFSDGGGNNPIPDGTSVSFNAEAGRIQNGSLGSCTTVNSECQMTWTSSGTMPTDGKVTILAFAVGVETFVDALPSNGQYDFGETYTDIPEAFLDANFNGSYDLGEFYVDAGEKDELYTDADLKYTGIQCSDSDQEAGFCERRFVNIFAQTEITVVSDELSCQFFNSDGDEITSVDLEADPSITVSVLVFDENMNTPGKDTEISATASNGVVNGDTSWTVQNRDTDITGGYRFDVELVSDVNTIDSGSLTIKSIAPEPSGHESQCKLTVVDVADVVAVEG